jgi:hypothetical protein
MVRAAEALAGVGLPEFGGALGYACFHGGS